MTIVVPALRAAVAPAPWVKNELWRNAREVPALDQPFADNKSLIDIISGQQLITHTRASVGTYRGSDGLIKTATTNEARFDHDPVTGESLGLLVEEQRTNLLLWSEEFDNPTWSESDASVSANETIAPDGNTTADKLVCGTGTPNFQGIAQSIAATASATRFSIYVKAAELDQVELRSFNPTDVAVFDLSTQQVLSQSLTPDPTITNAGNGWYRCSITSASSGATTFRISLASGGSRVFTPIPGAGLYIWGAQLEASTFPTSYIPTTSSTVTRSADVASITGANFSSWYRQDEGTIYHSYAPFGTAQNRRTYSFSDGTGNNQIRLVACNSSGAASNYVDITTSGAVQSFLGAGTALTATPQSGALGYMLNNTAFSRNGAAVSVDTSVTIPVVNKLDIGSDFNNTGPLNGTIRRLTYWPQRLPNDTLETITQ